MENIKTILDKAFIQYENELSEVFEDYDIETAKKMSRDKVIEKLIPKIEMYYRQLKII